MHIDALAATAGTLNKDLMLSLKERYQLSVFVETGTARGQTAAMAAEHFDQVYTIEADEGTYCHTYQFLKHFDNVEALLGRSDRVLWNVKLLHDKPCLFYLDAHWSGDGPRIGPECPLLGELDAIGGTDGRHVILIDDYRMFKDPPPPPHRPEEWPTLEDIEAKYKSWNDGTWGNVYGDVILLLPQFRYDEVSFEPLGFSS